MKTSELNLQVYKKPLQDGKQYLARVVGIAFLGHRPSPTFGNYTSRIRPEIMFSFEFLDEQTYISSKKPLIMHQIMTASPHPKSNLHNMALNIDKSSVTSYTEDVPSDSDEEDEEGLGQRTVYEINTPQLAYGLIKLTVRESDNRAGHFRICNMEEPTDMEKYLTTICPIQTPYIYDLTTDNLIQGNREDIPEGMLKWALKTMVDV
jgi:hypothetical protein